MRKRFGNRTGFIEKSKNNLNNLSDLELMKRWKAGTTQAADTIFDRYCIRLVALVSKRLSNRWKHQIDAEDIVQSALGSFFHRAKESRLHFSQSVSLWNLLALFAKRKMLRAIEQRSSQKRGGEFRQRKIENVMAELADPCSSSSVLQDDLDTLESELLATIPADCVDVVRNLLLGKTQKEIATELNVSDRTVRRRVEKLRSLLSGESLDSKPAPVDAFESAVLPRIHYSEFVLGRLVGAGSFGKVYRASLQEGGEIVAVKFLRKEFWQHQLARQTFLREIEQVSQVEHRAVQTYFGWGESPQGGPYIVSKWHEGRSLQQRHHEQPSTAEEFIECLQAIADGLAVVHAAGIVHGDVTPQNIMIDDRGYVTIIDFGFASKPVETAGSTTAKPVEPSGPLGGTLGWAAPEQIAESFGEISPQTDIWAIGALAYWFLTGRAPLAANTWGEMLIATFSDEPVDCDCLQTESSSEAYLKRIAELTLTGHDARPSSIDELRDRLQP